MTENDGKNSKRENKRHEIAGHENARHETAGHTVMPVYN